MKAMALAAPGGLDRITLVDASLPPLPASDEIMIRVRASTLNYHDLGVASGSGPLEAAADGRILLGDACGTVETVGAGVTEFAPGDMVVSCVFPQWQSGPPQVSDFTQTPGDGVDGFAREYATMPARAFTRAPKGYNHAEAATLTSTGITAWRALMVNGRLQAGDTVLVQGTGGLSLFALQIAVAAGATVIATSSSDEKLERLRALGAAHTINYRSDPDWGKSALRWTAGKGVDHVIDVGGSATLARSIEAVAIGGHVAMIGLLGGTVAALPVVPMLAKQIKLQGCLAGNRQDQTDLVAFLEKHDFRPVIDRTFALEQLAEAFAYQQTGRHFGKIIVEI